MGSFAEALSTERRKPTGRARCHVCTLLESDHPEVDLIAESVADQSIYGTTLARALQKVGVNISYQSINRHRSGKCQARRYG